MKWGKAVLGLALLALIVGGLVLAFLPGPAEVTVAVARRGPMAVTVEQEGRTRVRDRYLVSAPVAGVARRIDLEVGDAVSAGQILTRIEPARPALLDPRYRAQARARVAGAEGQLEAARARVAAAAAAAVKAAADLGRARKMHGTGFASAQALDRAEAADRQARAELRSARFQVQVAQAELESARSVLRYGAEPDAAHEGVAVRAPVAGRVLAIRHKSAGPVAVGAPLVEVGDPGAIEVEADVLSSDAVRIHPGMEVRLERWGGAGVLSARVTRVEPTAFTKVSALGIEEQRVWVIARITSPRRLWDRLGDGYRVDCSFVLWQGDNVLQVPDSAVFDAHGAEAVFVVERNEARLRRVEVGRRSGLTVQIVRGLKAGELVVTHPGAELRDGSAVRIRGRE